MEPCIADPPDIFQALFSVYRGAFAYEGYSNGQLAEQASKDRPPLPDDSPSPA
jgi:hypothetical protein